MSGTPVVVLGAGCAGLAAARRLREKGIPTVLIEAEDRVGGLAGGIRLGRDVYEYGPHIFHTTDARVMADVKALCIDAGFSCVQTYIASGNVLFASKRTATDVKAELESRLLKYAGRPISVFVRTAAEMRAILRANPFPTAEHARVYVFFLEA